MIDNSSVFIKREFFIHFAARKMAGRTIFYKDGFDLFFKVYLVKLLFRDFRRRNSDIISVLKVAGLHQQCPGQYDQGRFHSPQ